jgi:hypothetical protein
LNVIAPDGFIDLMAIVLANTRFFEMVDPIFKVLGSKNSIDFILA